MFDLDRWKEIGHALSMNKVRSLLTAFGVFWGIFMLIVMAGAGNGLTNGLMEGVARFATNSALVWTNRTSEPYKGYTRGRFWNMDSEDIKIIRTRVPELEILTPKNFGSDDNNGPNTIRGIRNGSFNIKGDYPDYVKIDPVTIVYGRWINEIDIREKRKVCVIGNKVYDTMFDPGENPLGEYLKISGVYYQVVGVIKPETRININGRTEESVSIPFTTMQQTYNMGNQVHVLAFTSKPGVPVSVAEEKIKSIIRQRHAISPTDVQAISSVNIEKQFLQIRGLFFGINILTWIVGIGTLMAGVIGVSNIMLVIVKERTREIGVQRALGARPATIITQVMLESVALTTVAGYIGLSLGVGLLELINRILESQSRNEEEIFFRHPEITISVALAALAVLIVAGLFAGSIPAKRAIQIKPIEALREE
ncbi:MAG: ABC transporter permease [Prolixibacteraceae bacterium]|jgi:putative ABC transport system permease protein|nr:ABC transporter permease [Prolixibacteraceae bacterium]MDI9562711.1 ABC transporter permease [Bacteroidota bacterium]NLS99656.1 ABC transporter permease [Bacteroidales bacterium]OQB81710.1 MAG: Macrolide export ATP-binding/permease protein MacB [Bacteroidetes bacterium ADurb.Bin123]HNZ67719.1 ABC transporter permease [Prolixibacteraceae bacterium]